MFRVFVCLLTVGLSMSALLAQQPARGTPAPTGTAIIRGRVIVAGDDRPLSRVEVRASSPAIKGNKAALTDGDGRYEIGELPAGRYTVSFSRVNYLRAAYGQRRPLGAGATIEVANGQVVTRVDAALQRPAAITGKVVDEFGDPITGAFVMPMRYAFINGQRRMQPAGSSGLSNDLGEYRIHSLTPGRYFLAATFRNVGDTSAYSPTYYPGTGNAAEAQRFTVAAGQSVAGINLTLLPVRAVRVSGVVLDAGGRPMPGAVVDMAQRAGFGTLGSTFAQSRPDGTFTIGGVTPGDYTLRASMPSGAAEMATADLTVTTADVGDVQLVAAKPSMLRGRVVFDGADLKPPLPAAVRVSVVQSHSTSTMRPFQSPKDDWTFEIKAPAGHMWLRTGVVGTGDWRLKRVMTADGADLTDAGFDVPVNATVDGLVVQMTSRHTEISGTVVDAAGASVRDCIVVLFAQDRSRWTVDNRFFGVGRPDRDNVYKVRLSAGDYYAVAFEQDDPMASLDDPEILLQLRDHATRITIGEGEKKMLSLTLSEPPLY